MNYRTQDVIVWDGFPHPDPRSRHAETSVRIAPSFWSRLAQHVRDARASAPARALWENWLTPRGVSALASRAAVDLDDAFAPRAATTTRVRRDAGDLPAIAIERLRATIAASLETPLAMCFHTGATSSSRPALYCLVLTNGATLTLRGHLTTLEAEDCFFSRAAVEASHDVDSAGTHTDATIEAFRNEFNDLSAAAALLSLGGGAFRFVQSGTAAPALQTRTAAVTSLRAAVAGEMVRRYAAVDDSKQVVLPEGGAARGGGDLGCKRVSFLEPQAWGFAENETGARWMGSVSLHDSDKPTNKNGTHHSRSLNGSTDLTTTDRRNVNGNSNRISFPGTPARMNGHATPMPRPVMPGNPPAAPADRPASNRFHPTEPSRNELPTAATRADGLAHLEQRTAYRALVALGECRVFGFALGEADAETTTSVLVLPADLAIAAASELEHRLARWTADAEDLRDRLQSSGGVAAEDLRLGLLESRMEAWVAYLTLDSSYSAALDAADPDADRLSLALDSILTRIEAFDEALQLCEPCLAISDETPLLANWRKMLADAYRDTPPWWLERTPALATPQ